MSVQILTPVRIGREYGDDGRRPSHSARGRGRGKSRRISGVDTLPSYPQQVYPSLPRTSPARDIPRPRCSWDRSCWAPEPSSASGAFSSGARLILSPDFAVSHLQYPMSSSVPAAEVGREADRVERAPPLCTRWLISTTSSSGCPLLLAAAGVQAWRKPHLFRCSFQL